MTTLIGKLFIGVHDDALRSGIIEAAINDHTFLVRFDKFVGFADGSSFPESLAVVPVGEMIGIVACDCDVPPPWDFFDSAEQRGEFHTWASTPPTSADGRIQQQKLRLLNS